MQSELLIENQSWTVHVVPHSHQDAGWIFTPEEYLEDRVKGIFNSVVNYLYENPDKKFNHAEVWFFKSWYESVDEEMRNKLKTLVKDKRFEFVNGGWVASDEACPTYEDFIENIVQGNRFLQDEFNITPKIAWHADAFGHSTATNLLFS
jgi:alpha-mannosidase